MKEITKVVVDAMGGDNAPHEIIKGAVEAVGKSDAIHVILVGKEDVINQELSGYTYNKEQISVVHTSEVIETAEPPVMAIRRKKDSSIVVGLKMVKDKEATLLFQQEVPVRFLPGDSFWLDVSKGWKDHRLHR